MTTKFNPKARADEIAAQLKAAEEAQASYNAAIDEAVNHAGRTRAEFVEVLYDHFGIEPESTVRKDKEGKPVLNKDGEQVVVKTDKDEAVRIEKLARAFEDLVARDESKTHSGSGQPTPSRREGGSTAPFGEKAA